MVAVEPLPPPGFVWATLDEDVSPNADVADILDGSVKAEGPAMAAIKQARNDAQAALSSSEQPAAAPATIAPTAGMTKTERLRAEGSAIVALRKARQDSLDAILASRSEETVTPQRGLPLRGQILAADPAPPVSAPTTEADESATRAFDWEEVKASLSTTMDELAEPWQDVSTAFSTALEETVVEGLTVLYATGCVAKDYMTGTRVMTKAERLRAEGSAIVALRKARQDSLDAILASRSEETVTPQRGLLLRGQTLRRRDAKRDAKAVAASKSARREVEAAAMEVTRQELNRRKSAANAEPATAEVELVEPRKVPTLQAFRAVREGRMRKRDFVLSRPRRWATQLI